MVWRTWFDDFMIYEDASTWLSILLLLGSVFGDFVFSRSRVLALV